MPPMRLHTVQTPAKVPLPSFARKASPLHFIVLHGFLAHSGAMNSFVVMLRNALDAHNTSVLESNDTTAVALPFHITTVDARNHGLSPHRPTHVLKELVDDLDAFLQYQFPETVREAASSLELSSSSKASHNQAGSRPPKTRVMAVGHSMGSMTWTRYLMDRYVTAAASPSAACIDVQGLVSMDMPPVTQSNMSTSLVGELVEILECMKKVDLRVITDLRTAHDEFCRCGMHDIRIRGLCTTNLALTTDPANPTTRKASWKCNVPVLEDSIRRGDLFFPDSYAKPALSLSSSTADAAEARAYPSVEAISVLSILGGASPIGGDEKYQRLWERYALRLEEKTVPHASHTVYYDKPRQTIDLVLDFLKHTHVL